MALVAIPANQWVAVVTTTGNTIVQNMDSHYPIYISTEDTTGDPLTNGILLPPNAAITFGTGISVSASSVNRPGIVSYQGS